MKRVVAWFAVVVVAVQLLAFAGFVGYDTWRVRQADLSTRVEMEMTEARLRAAADTARAEADRLRAEMVVLLAAGETAAADDCRRRTEAADRAADAAQQRLVVAETELRVFKESGRRPSASLPSKKG